MEGRKAIVVSNDGTHFFEVGEIIEYVKDSTAEYFKNGEKLQAIFYTFKNLEGFIQDLEKHEFDWLSDRNE